MSLKERRIKRKIGALSKDLPIIVYKTIDSTNTQAKLSAENGQYKDAVFVASEQTAGRGRLGRSFFSPDGTGLYMSLLLRPDLPDCDLLIVEDIIDSGRTLSYLTRYLEFRGAKSVKTCTLLDKPARRKVDFVPDYVGKVIPDEFVFGYGLDLFEKYRDLPYVAVVSDEYLKNLK